MSKSKEILDYISKNKLLTEKEVLEVVPIGRKGWLTGVDSGIYPKPIRWGKKFKYWKEKDIMTLLNEGTK